MREVKSSQDQTFSKQRGLNKIFDGKRIGSNNWQNGSNNNTRFTKGKLKQLIIYLKFKSSRLLFSSLVVSLHFQNELKNKKCIIAKHEMLSMFCFFM